MMELRQKIAREIYEGVDDPNYIEMPDAEEIADRILAIPEIAEALKHVKALTTGLPLNLPDPPLEQHGDT